MIKTFGIEIFSSAGAINKNTLLIPAQICNETDKLCRLKDEYIGWIICRKSFISDFIVLTAEYSHIAGKGDSISVFLNPRLEEQYRKIINLDPQQYEAIEFHTHPVKTPLYFNDHFSDGDLITLNKRQAIIPAYKHLLFTVTNILLYNASEAEFSLRVCRISNYSDYQHMYKKWQTYIST